jgi:SAM-dependent methyltransferase
LQPDVYLRKQEFERGLIKWLKWKNYPSLSEIKLLEIGCGGGFNLLKFIELGFRPENILGNELISERVVSARKILPKEIEIIEGDALKLTVLPNSYDIVFQSTVFSSILNSEFQKELAAKLWTIAKPDGGILWYDFTYNNPRNRDVVGITLKKIRQLFPHGIITHWRITLAPPIGRFVTKFHPNLYSLFNTFPFLRTHILCWIEKK